VTKAFYAEKQITRRYAENRIMSFHLENHMTE